MPISKLPANPFGVLQTFLKGFYLKINEMIDAINGGSPDPTTSSNAGAGNGLALAKVGNDLPFKTIIAGANVSITPAADTITIDAAAGGEVNTSSNAGAGNGLAMAKVGADLPFKTIIAGTNVTITPAADTITIDVASSGDNGVVYFQNTQSFTGFPLVHTFACPFIPSVVHFQASSQTGGGVLAGTCIGIGNANAGFFVESDKVSCVFTYPSPSPTPSVTSFAADRIGQLISSTGDAVKIRFFGNVGAGLCAFAIDQDSGSPIIPNLTINAILIK